MARVSDAPAVDASYEVECPHCHRTFTAEVMTGSAGRYQGFKCPHCKLFVPFERADEQELVERLD